MNEIQEKQFETVSDSDVLKVLETDSEKGLSSQEAADRLAKFGPNKLQEEKKKSWIRIYYKTLFRLKFLYQSLSLIVLRPFSVYCSCRPLQQLCNLVDLQQARLCLWSQTP